MHAHRANTQPMFEPRLIGTASTGTVGGANFSGRGGEAPPPAGHAATALEYR